MFNEVLDNICKFLIINRTVFDNVVSTVIYFGYVILAVKNKNSWVTFLIGYLFISTALTFIGLTSYLNIVSLIVKMITDFFNSIFASV